MRRIRLVFVALAVVLAVPLALLLDRTLSSVAAERVLRHRTVADRVIDEMERELNELVRREEERPYGHYRFLFVPEDGSVLERSPLATLPEEPFILGYFQIDPDGSVSTPMWPEDPAAARADGWTPDGDLLETVELLSSTVRAAWETPPSAQRAITPGAAKVQETKRFDPAQEPPTTPTNKDDDALDVIQKLNRAATVREKRGSKVEATQAESLYSFSRPYEQERRAGSASPDDLELAGLVAGSRAMREARRYDVRLEPLMGRPASDQGLLLYRTVLIGRQVYRQGLLLSRPELVDWLAGRVIESTGLGGAITIQDGSTDVGGGQFTYHHRFAEPFGSLVATLVLRPLPERRGASYVLSLAVLLVVCAALGFFALYRMTAVVVSFAHRRSDFVSAVTHELKTPLTAVRMYGEMLRDGLVPEEKRGRYYATITAEAERLSRLIDNVLELSRLERKTRDVRLESGEIEPILRQVISTLEPHAEKERLALRLEIGSELPTVRFDRDALLQVLFNLLDNAIKYSASATEREIVLAARPAAEGAVAIRIQDRGPGVAAQELERIFEPFYRVQRELTRTTRGSGIGLALVRGLMEKMGGAARARNREGGGLEVEIVLPAA